MRIEWTHDRYCWLKVRRWHTPIGEVVTRTPDTTAGRWDYEVQPKSVPMVWDTGREISRRVFARWLRYLRRREVA